MVWRGAMEPAVPPSRTVLDMNRYQWTVLLAAWLGWGFDVFDGLLFNYVAPNCVPTLLGLPLGSAEAAEGAPEVRGPARPLRSPRRSPAERTPAAAPAA